MKIELGATHVVILVGTKAFKIGKTKFFTLIRKSVTFFLVKKARRQMVQKYGRIPLGGVKSNIFAGLIANRNEHRYYSEKRDPRVMPVLKQLLGGLIIVQERGTPISQEDLETASPFRLPTGQDLDLTKAKQFCRRESDGQIVLIDFGREDTIAFLESTFCQPG